MNRPPVFLELCAGSAAATLRLLDRKARPPCSHMGGKAKYADAILHALGLRSGTGAGQVVLVEADPDWARTWRLLSTATGCAAASQALRQWEGEDPRRLWLRLNARRKAGEPWTSEPVAVAAWLFLHAGSFCEKGPDHGIGRPEGYPIPVPGHMAQRPSLLVMRDRLAALSRIRWPPCTVLEQDVATADVDRWLAMPGAVAVFDPPYQDTTPYKGTPGLTRQQVLDTALRCQAAGARVAVCEAEPLPLPGWHHVETTGARVGARRTFSRQQAEWLTLSHAPPWATAWPATLTIR